MLDALTKYNEVLKNFGYLLDLSDDPIFTEEFVNVAMKARKRYMDEIYFKHIINKHAQDLT